MDDLTQYEQGEPDDSQDTSSFNVGTVMTSQGNFDTTIGTDVWSEGEEENAPESTESFSPSMRGDVESSTTGATYASNKRARTRKRMEQIQKEMKEVEARPSSAGGDMMQILVFMHEEADRRSETEDRRSREDRGARLVAERQERMRESLFAATKPRLLQP
uniref:Uncharacterized protein n=1 Tax=Phytophthora ramorum TaxID=164328 RepID=H3H2S7_PHYRM